ncbi:hypothetical protein Slin14017_G087810 [Septoria linicola]|nr:hypothetical protein Slin14017_G087810 [Septoria linicola]
MTGPLDLTPGLKRVQKRAPVIEASSLWLSIAWLSPTASYFKISEIKSSTSEATLQTKPKASPPQHNTQDHPSNTAARMSVLGVWALCHIPRDHHNQHSSTSTISQSGPQPPTMAKSSRSSSTSSTSSSSSLDADFKKLREPNPESSNPTAPRTPVRPTQRNKKQQQQQQYGNWLSGMEQTTSSAVMMAGLVGERHVEVCGVGR